MGFSGAGRARNDIFLGFRGRAGTVSRFGGRGRAEPAMVSRASARNNFGGFAVSRAVSRLRGRAEPATIFFERRCKAFWKFEEIIRT